MITTDPFGKVKSWTCSKTRRSIIFPETVIPGGDRARGAAPVCAPLFGPQPTTWDWLQMKLPRHGLVRLLDKVRDAHMVSRSHGQQGMELYRIAFDPSIDYPWAFSVGIGLKYDAEDNQLLHHLEICRTDERRNSPMPFSLGFHPYFATHGEFELKVGSYTMATEVSNLTEGIRVRNRLGLVLETKHGTLDITGTGNDEYVIWSDDPTRYICIEPVLGLDGEHTLEPGEHQKIMTLMKYTPKNV